MLRAERLHPALAALLLAASALLGFADLLPTAPRVAFVLCYLLLAPGYALLPFFGEEHWLLHALLALSMGVALAVGIATAMSETGWWRVEVGVAATGVIVVGAVAWRTWRNRAALAHLVGGIS